jgi:dTDP-4-amino-4,6-dideoxygalactose transaminase
MGGGRFPQAERAWKESLSIPLYPSLSPSDQAKVIAAVRSAL